AVARQGRERQRLISPGDHGRVELEVEGRTEPPDRRLAVGDEVLEADDGDVPGLRGVVERDPVRVRPVLGDEPELLVRTERDAEGRRLAPDRPVAPAVRV